MQTQIHFYDTIGLPPVQREDANDNAKGQEQKILDFFNLNRGEFSPSDLFKRCLLGDAPIQSYRRALSNLSSKKWHYVLKKLDLMKPGLYGEKYPEHLWRLR